MLFQALRYLGAAMTDNPDILRDSSPLHQGRPGSGLVTGSLC